MAPPPENDNTPKAPDKNEKFKGDKHGNTDACKEKNKDIKTLNNLNDCELRDLLDEAITYKNPKDREGKSTLFKELLSQAEESERNARAASAGGSEQVRYCNTSAKRSKHRRKPNSISENVMHGGSLDNLAKEELFEVSHHLNRPKRTVSARQREGGSLPSNVNAGSLASYDPHFLEEARQKRSAGGGGSPEPMDVDVDMETVSLLDHDSVAENFDGGAPTLELIENVSPQSARKFTTNATLQVNVDDALHFNDLDPIEKKPYEMEQISAKVVQSKCSVYIQKYGPLSEASKKVDENGNALHQNITSKGKKKKVQADKNVVSCVAAEKVEGHRSDIIHDVDKLVQFIGENDKPQGGAQSKANAHRSSKQLHKHTSEEGPRGGKKQRAQSSKGKENRSELKKSNSMGEISTTKLDNFEFDGTENQATVESGGNEVVVVLRAKKESVGDKTRERRSWGNVEHQVIQNFYKNPSTENLETASSSDFRVVTKKKKTKKRRSSVSGSRRKLANTASSCANSSKSDGDRASSPVVPRRKSACSVPHSEKSNDSSDVDSVHSLPIDSGQRMDSSQNSEEAPISYADIARNSERKLNESNSKKPFSEVKVNEPTSPEGNKSKTTSQVTESVIMAELPPKVVVNVQSMTTPLKVSPPDVHNIKSFPAIHSTNTKNERLTKVDKPSNKSVKTNQQQQVKQQNMVQNNNVANADRGSRNLTNDNATTEVEVIEQNDIQNNLSIIQANEMDTIQFNSQIIPALHIPDVQTIEKIHFMNQPGAHMPAHLQQHVVPPQHLHMALPHPHHHSPLRIMPMTTDMYTNGRAPAAYTAIISHTPHAGVAYVKAAQAYEGAGVAYMDHAYPPKDGPGVVPNSTLVTVTTQTNNVDSLSSNNKSVDNEHANSGANSKQHKSKYNRRSPNNSVKDVPQVYQPSPNPTVITNENAGYREVPTAAQDDLSAAPNCDSRTNANDCASSEDSSSDHACSSRPPVVILSGLSNKEVPGLVFGFDVNEELLSEDICDNFVERYVAPPTYTATSHNHDKIVEFVSTAWEDVCQQHALGKAQYYSDSL